MGSLSSFSVVLIIVPYEEPISSNYLIWVILTVAHVILLVQIPRKGQESRLEIIL